MLDVFTCQSSSLGKRKSTSCCGFMFFIKSKACSGTNIFFISLFGTERCKCFSISSGCFFIPLALFYYSFSSSAHNKIAPHFFNRK